MVAQIQTHPGWVLLPRKLLKSLDVESAKAIAAT
jgi:hypothetical protein